MPTLRADVPALCRLRQPGRHKTRELRIEHVLSPTNSIAIIGPDYSQNERVLTQITSRLTIIEDYLGL